MSDEDEEELEQEQSKKRGRGRPRKPVGPVTEKTKQLIEAKIAERIKSYSEDFDLTTLTTIDRQNIRNMASLEMAAEAANIQLAGHSIGASPLTPTEFKALSDSVKVVMAEARQQAAALGIDRKTRLSGEQSELEMYLPKLAAEAKTFLYRDCIAIICLECRKSEAQVDIRTGFISSPIELTNTPAMQYHFFEEDLEWSATFKCQREDCGKLFTIDRTNWKDYRMATVDEIQPPLSDKEKEEEAEDEADE